MTNLRGRVSKRALLPIMITTVAAVPFAIYLFAMPSSTNSHLTTSPELLNLGHYTIASDSGQGNPTNLTMWLRNDGAFVTTISSLSVHDQNPNSSPVTFQMNGTTISPGTTKTITVDTLSSNFYFSHGVLYQATLVTSRAILSYSINY